MPSVRCPLCGTERTINVDPAGYARWQAGELIQNAMPTLSPEEREGLITGYCTPCWDRMANDP